MNKLELNRVAIWRPKAIDQLTMKTSPAGRIAYEGHIATTTTRPTNRFAKNYGEGALRFCLFVVTYRDDSAGVEAELDAIAEAISDDIKAKAIEGATDTAFTYTNQSIKD